MEPTLSEYDRIVKLINNNCKPEEAVELEEYLKELWEYYDGAMNIYNGWKEEEE